MKRPAAVAAGDPQLLLELSTLSQQDSPLYTVGLGGREGGREREKDRKASGVHLVLNESSQSLQVGVSAVPT